GGAHRRLPVDRLLRQRARSRTRRAGLVARQGLEASTPAPRYLPDGRFFGLPAISSAGGVRFEALDRNLMLAGLPGVFCAGEMLDWEAPTGGYLLTACFASGRVAGLGALAWLRGRG
ncbi:NAD(P)/FAD-dependent oxidoreductase, partial [Pseudomonas aeruginosa]